MKIIITGATGSCGAALVRYFAKKGHEVIAVGRMPQVPTHLLEYAKEYIVADMQYPHELRGADICIHAAARSDDKGAKADFLRDNVQGSLHVLEAASACKQFIFISSSSVYMPANGPIPESLAGQQNTQELSNYGYSKWLAEQAISAATQAESTVILRPRALYGIGDKMIFPRLLKFVKKGVLQRVGPMKARVSMTHYDNLCHAIDLAIEKQPKGTNVYNVADASEYVLADVLRELTTAFYGKELPEKELYLPLIRFLARFHLGGLSPLLVRALTEDLVLDIRKIKAELGYQPSATIASSIPQISEWLAHIGGVEELKKGTKDLAWR